MEYDHSMVFSGQVMDYDHSMVWSGQVMDYESIIGLEAMYCISEWKEKWNAENLPSNISTMFGSNLSIGMWSNI